MVSNHPLTLTRNWHNLRYGYRGMGWLGWQSDTPTTGVVSPPNVATSVSVNPRLGYAYGPRFYLKSFYVTPYCRDYVRVNVTGYVQVSYPAMLRCIMSHISQ